MRIESIDIRGFGCLTDRRYEFPADRATLIIADNETGKSTLAAAILAGICGFPNERRGQGKMTLRERYQPWNGEAYAVEMDILVGEKRLRIERDFARGSFVVRDRDTGKDISSGCDPDVALQILHLPREDFERIAFISGKEVPSFDRAQTIQSRLSALADGSGDDTGAEVAMAALDNARYTLDTGGPLKTQTAIGRLGSAIEDKRSALNALDASLEQAGEEAGRLDESKALQAELSTSLTDLDSEHRAARLAEEQSNTRQVEELRVELVVGQAESRLGTIKQARHAGKQSGTAVAFGGIALALVSFGMFILGFLRVGPSVAGALIGIAIAAAGAVWATKAGVANAEEKVRLERQIEEARSQLGHAKGEAPPNSQRSSTEIEAEQRDLRNEIGNLNGLIIELEKRVGATVDTYRRDYATFRSELSALEHELAKAQRFGAALDIARDVLGEVAESSHRRWAAALNERASAILPHLNPNYEDLLFDDSLGFTIRHVSDNRMLQKTEIDARLSTGAKDQVYLAVRLAFCEELSRDGEPIPVLLDDPLLAADDARFAGGLRYLTETLAKGHQVLILSCSRQRHERLIGEEWFANCARLTV